MQMKKKLKIIYEDKYLIAVYKQNGLLTVANDKEKERTLYHYVLEYLKSKKQKVFIIHRLDKDTSGIVLFAKDEKIKHLMQENWDNVIREYLAITLGNVENDKGIIKLYLAETKTLLTYVGNKNNGKLAITEYTKLMSNKKYSLLKLNLKTGRKNQIRVSLSNIGYPIIGDKKYGTNIDPIHKMALLANYLEFIHPITKEKIVLDLGIPKEYLDFMKK
jgi:23S rRNA pseudouridine1911/1915/1917 synthase